jgi:hypothetical protein
MAESSPVQQPKKTLEEANALVPELARIVGGQMQRRGEIERKLSELAIEQGSPADDLSPKPEDSRGVRDRKVELEQLITEYQGKWTELEDIGGVLKDPRQGLVDFYGEVDGELVWLCWKFGERSIAHYHKLREGFSSRKPIDAGAKRKLLN